MQRIGVLMGSAEGFNLPALRFLILQLNRLQRSFEYEFLRPDSTDPLVAALVDGALVDREEIRNQVPAFIDRFTARLKEKNKAFSLLEPPPDSFVFLTLATFKDNYFSMRQCHLS